MPSPSPSRLLPIRLVPTKRESLKGLLQRAAQANGYGNLLWITEAAGLPPSSLINSLDLSTLSRLMDLETAELNSRRCNVEHRTTILGGNAISRTFLDLRKCRLCALCVSETGISDLRWDISNWVACPEHGVMLTDRCGECGKWIDWRRRHVEACDCGASLLGRTCEAPPAAVAVIQELDRRFNWDAENPDWKLNDTLEILSLVSFIRRKGDREPRKTVNEKLHDLVEGSGMILRWPDGYHEWLSAQRRVHPGQTGIHADFGPVLRRIQAACREDNPVVEETRRHLKGCGIVLKRWSYFHSGDGSTDSISGAEAGRLLNVSHVGLRELVEKGHIAAEYRKGGGSNILTVSRESVESLRKRFKKGLTVKQLAVRLGVAKHQVDRLYYDGFLAPLPKLGYRVRFPADTARVLERRIAEVSNPERPRGKKMCMADLPQLHQVDFMGVFRRIIANLIPLELKGGPRPLFRRLFVQADQLMDEGLNVDEAAALIGVHNRMITHLVRANCLKQELRGGTRYRAKYRSITVSDVESFRNEYVLTREVALALSTNSRMAISRLLQANCVPVIEHCSRSQISAVWLRSEVVSAGLL